LVTILELKALDFAKFTAQLTSNMFCFKTDDTFFAANTYLCFAQYVPMASGAAVLLKPEFQIYWDLLHGICPYCTYIFPLDTVFFKKF
jgi:hypothetical protein